jgi:hypothetical protein
VPANMVLAITRADTKADIALNALRRILASLKLAH